MKIAAVQMISGPDVAPNLATAGFKDRLDSGYTLRFEFHYHSRSFFASLGQSKHGPFYLLLHELGYILEKFRSVAAFGGEHRPHIEQFRA